jgi:hypothetical protein
MDSRAAPWRRRRDAPPGARSKRRRGPSGGKRGSARFDARRRRGGDESVAFGGSLMPRMHSRQRAMPAARPNNSLYHARTRRARASAVMARLEPPLSHEGGGDSRGAKVLMLLEGPTLDEERGPRPRLHTRLHGGGAVHQPGPAETSRRTRDDGRAGSPAMEGRLGRRAAAGKRKFAGSRKNCSGRPRGARISLCRAHWVIVPVDDDRETGGR